MSKQLVDSINNYHELYRGIDWNDFEAEEAEHLVRTGEDLIQQLAREVVLCGERRGKRVADA